MTGAEGERKRGLYADLSFGDWQQSKTGDPSVVLTAASSPRRGAKGAVQQQRCGLGAPGGCGDGSANQSVNDTAPNAVCEYCIKFQRQNSAKC